jgi:hypothetical protein
MFPDWPTYGFITAAVTVVLVVLEITVRARAFWGMFLSGPFWRYFVVSLFVNELALFFFKGALFREAHLPESVFMSVLASRTVFQQMSVKWGGLDLDIREMQNQSMADAVEDILKNMALRKHRKRRRLAAKLRRICLGEEAWLEEQYIFFNPQGLDQARASLTNLQEKHKGKTDLYYLEIANSIVEQDYHQARAFYWDRRRKKIWDWIITRIPGRRKEN